MGCCASRVTQPVTASSRLISGILRLVWGRWTGTRKIFLSSILGLLYMNYANGGDVQWLWRVGNLSKITIHTLRANCIQNEANEDLPAPKGRQSKLRVLRFGVELWTHRAVYQKVRVFGYDGLENFRRGPMKITKETPPITISVRLNLCADAGQMRFIAVGLGRMIKIRIWGGAAERAYP